MKKTVRSVNTGNDGESKSFLQKCFGVDRWCTVYEEDEAFRLLADLTLCMYFGCGKTSGAEDDAEVPTVVSVTTSDDCDCSDTISDICEDRHCSSAKQEETPLESRKPDPPSRRSDAILATGIPPPPPRPTSIDSPSTEKQKIVDESSRVAAHYGSREALEDSDAAHFSPPSTVIVKAKRRTNRRPLQREELLVFYNESSDINHCIQDDVCPEHECPMDEYPVIGYSDTRSGLFGYV